MCKYVIVELVTGQYWSAASHDDCYATSTMGVTHARCRPGPPGGEIQNGFHPPGESRPSQQRRSAGWRFLFMTTLTRLQNTPVISICGARSLRDLSVWGLCLEVVKHRKVPVHKESWNETFACSITHFTLFKFVSESLKVIYLWRRLQNHTIQCFRWNRPLEKQTHEVAGNGHW